MLRRSPPWTEADDAELRRLAQAGYSLVRMHLRFQRPSPFLAARLRTLGLQLKKPSRLPADQRFRGPG
jgi:hypothetical protein